MPYAKNARTHSPEQVDQLVASIKEWGWTTPVLLDEHGGIIAGHGRVLAAKQLKLETVPCMVARGWSEAQKRAYVLADNKLALNAGWDESLLKLEIADLEIAAFDVTLLGFSAAEMAELLDEQDTGPKPGDETLADGGAPVPLGSAWRLQRHLLICGDCSDTAAVARALAGRTVDLAIYDPPYDVAKCWDFLRNDPAALIFADYRHVKEAFRTAANFESVYQFVWDGFTSWYTPNKPLARHKQRFFARMTGDGDLTAPFSTTAKSERRKLFPIPAATASTRRLETAWPICRLFIRSQIRKSKAATLTPSRSNG